MLRLTVSLLGLSACFISSTVYGLPNPKTIEVAERSSTLLDQYIVIFKEDTTLQKRQEHQSWLESLTNRTQEFLDSLVDGSEDTAQSLDNGVKGYLNVGSLQGYFGSFSDSIIEQIKNSDEISIVEQDSLDTVQDTVFLQLEAPWGLSRISHVEDPQGTSDDTKYLFRPPAGNNVAIYILDTGVNINHTEFSGRARWGPNYADDENWDNNGHGTHVAGIAAGNRVGVAKFSDIVSVKVMGADKTGAVSGVIQAISWVIQDHQNSSNAHAVINYSAAGAPSDARKSAIDQALAAGIIFVNAAGNSAQDACNFGPSDMGQNNTGFITVAALDQGDIPASFTNFGQCVSVYSPGVNILSALNTNNTGYVYMSGTSMSSPSVAGLAAYYWSLDPSQSVSDIYSLSINSNDGAVQNNIANTPNKIAFNNYNRQTD